MKRKLSVIALVLLWYSISTAAQSAVGVWKGILEVPGTKLPLIFHVRQNSATMDSPNQGAMSIPADSVVFSEGQLKIEIRKIGGVYTGALVNADSISGTFTQMGHSLPLHLSRLKDTSAVTLKRPQEPHPPFPYKTEEVSFINNEQGNTLAGTLTTPANKQTYPVVIMITGSGPQNRDEELFGHKPFWVIADYFTRRGIGVLRMDDRGVGGSSAGKQEATSADFATDISAAVTFMKSRGYKQIGLAGHSEGGMIAPIVATQNPAVKFIVSMAGPGIAIDSLMISQLKAASKAMNVPEAAININVMVARKAYSIAKYYKGTHLKEDLTDSLLKTFPLVSEMDKSIANVFSAPWFAYFIKFDPQSYIQQLKIPVLAINGSLDVQVIANENLEGWKHGLQKAGNKDFTVHEFPGLNHLFQPAKTGAMTEYGQIEQTIAPEVLELMTSWILKHNK